MTNATAFIIFKFIL